jgi:hypothetical protein
VVSIHQPHYFPWLGLAAKIACSDIFILLDNVQFEKNGWQYRTRYATAQGLKYLSLSVAKAGVVSQGLTIDAIRLADRRAPRKHWKTLQQRYGKTPGWPRIASRLEAILLADHPTLIPLCLATTQLTLELFRLQPKTVLASGLPVSGQKSERVLNLVRAVGGTHYLSGAGALTYLDQASFRRAGVGLSFQQFTHPTYPQSTRRPFAPGAFALEWYLEDPEGAVEQFHKHLERNPNQPPRCGRPALDGPPAPPASAARLSGPPADTP